MRVLVTGGAGFIGSHLVRACLAQGHEVRVLDDLSSGSRRNLRGFESDLELVEASIVDLEATCGAARGVEVVFHQAAIASVPLSVDDPVRTHAVNASGTVNVLEAARRAGARRVVIASSSAVYGDDETLPKVETLPPNPLSPYALQKLESELYAARYEALYGLETVALRYFNVYGPRQDPASMYAGVIPRFSVALAENRPPRIYGDGRQSRDFVFVGDVVAANLAAATVTPSSHWGPINIGGGCSVTVLELVERMTKVLGIPRLQPVFEPARAGDVRHSRADVSRARQRLGWEPATDLDAGLAVTVPHYVELGQ